MQADIELSKMSYTSSSQQQPRFRRPAERQQELFNENLYGVGRELHLSDDIIDYARDASKLSLENPAAMTAALAKKMAETQAQIRQLEQQRQSSTRPFGSPPSYQPFGGSSTIRTQPVQQQQMHDPGSESWRDWLWHASAASIYRDASNRAQLMRTSAQDLLSAHAPTPEQKQQFRKAAITVLGVGTAVMMVFATGYSIGARAAEQGATGQMVNPDRISMQTSSDGKAKAIAVAAAKSKLYLEKQLADAMASVSVSDGPDASNRDQQIALLVEVKNPELIAKLMRKWGYAHGTPAGRKFEYELILAKEAAATRI